MDVTPRILVSQADRLDGLEATAGREDRRGSHRPLGRIVGKPDKFVPVPTWTVSAFTRTWSEIKASSVVDSHDMIGSLATYPAGQAFYLPFLGQVREGSCTAAKY